MTGKFPGWQRPAAVVPGLLLLGLIVLPVLWISGYSLVYSLGGTGLFSTGWTTVHWREVFRAGELRNSLVYSAAVASGISLLSVVLALTFVLCVPETRRSGWLLAVFCIPMATPPAVMAMLVYQWLNPGGVLARVAFRLGWIGSPSDFPELVNDAWSAGIVLAGTCSSFPLLTLYFLKTWDSARIDRYCRMAESLGAASWRARWTIARPMLLNRGRSLILLIFLWNLGSFEIPLLLGVQSPQLLSVTIQRRSGQYDVRQRPQAFVLASAYVGVVAAGVAALTFRRRTDD